VNIRCTDWSKAEGKNGKEGCASTAACFEVGLSGLLLIDFLFGLNLAQFKMLSLEKGTARKIAVVLYFSHH
jgi:hypothetical protein